MIILLMLLANINEPGSSPYFWGAVPQSAQTFLYEKNGASEFVGIKLNDDQWLNDLRQLKSQTIHGFLYRDAPWRGAPPLIGGMFLNDLKLSEERSQSRRERLLKGWKNAGYVWVEYPDGLKRPVQNTVYEKALKAQKMAQTRDVKPVATTSPQDNTPNTATTNTAGFWSRWGRHIIIVAIGLALLGGVLKFFFFNPDDQWDEVKTPDRF